MFPLSSPAAPGAGQQRNTRDKDQSGGNHTKRHGEGCSTSQNLPTASAASRIKDVCLYVGGGEALLGILRAKPHPQASWNL